MPKPTQSFIKKVTSNQRRLQRLRYLDRNSFRDTNQAKACHSLIHNLIEHYKLEDEVDAELVSGILYELGGAFGFLSELTYGQFRNMEVYQDRLVIPPNQRWE